MRELHVVALSEDGRSVVLATSATATKGGYRVRLDGPLTAAVRGELRRPGEPAAPEVDLTPKDIQARLRAGETPAQIAESAGVPVARVERFEGPVISERQRVIEQTRTAHLVRGRKGASALPLGDVVDHHLAETASLVEDSVEWSARRLDDGTWEVALRFVARARARTARWTYDPATRIVTGVDSASAAMGHSDRAALPAHKPTAAPAKGTKSTTRASTPKAAPTRALPKAAPRAAAKKPTVAKAAPKKAAVAKAAPAKAAVKKAPLAKAAVTKVAVKKAAPAKAAPIAPRKAPRKAAAPAPVALPKARARRAAPTRAVARTAGQTPAQATPPPAEPRRVLRIVTDDPLETTPAVARRAAGSRASVPAWADVLLGATPSTQTGATRDDD